MREWSLFTENEMMNPLMKCVHWWIVKTLNKYNNNRNISIVCCHSEYKSISNNLIIERMNEFSIIKCMNWSICDIWKLFFMWFCVRHHRNWPNHKITICVQLFFKFKSRQKKIHKKYTHVATHCDVFYIDFFLATNLNKNQNLALKLKKNRIVHAQAFSCATRHWRRNIPQIVML